MSDEFDIDSAIADLSKPATGGAPIDTTRPIIHNDDGSFSTERTITVESDGTHYVIPTIVGGRQRSPDEAVQLWRSGTNQQVGAFRSAQEANDYAVQRSKNIGALRGADAAFDIDAAVGDLAKARTEDKALNAQFLRYRQQNASMPPEQQADVFRTAAALRTMGETPDLEYVAKNIDPLKKRVEAHGAKWDQLLADHPGLKDYLLEQPQRQDLIKDDLDNTNDLMWALRVPYMAQKREVAQQAYNALTFKAATGFDSAVNQEAIKGLKPQVENSLYGAEHWWSKAYAGAFNMAPMILKYGLAGLVGAEAGVAAAAPGELAAGGATIEIGGLGAVPAAAAAATGGAAVATAALTYYETLGPAYQRMVDQGVRPEIARRLATAEAGVTGLIFSGMMPKLLGKLGINVDEVARDVGPAVSDALAKKTVPQALAKAAMQHGENVAHAAVMMGAIGGVSQTTDEMARLIDRGETPSAPRIAAAITDSMENAVRDMILISGFAPAHEALGNVGEAMRLADDQRQLETLLTATAGSKLLERSPDEFKSLIATLGQSGLKKFYSPIDDFNAYWESRRANPREVASKLVGDDGTAYDRAVSSGGDLVMPVDNYLAVLGKTEHARGLSQDIKIRTDGRTPRQEQARIERRAAELAKVPDADIKMEQGRELVADWFRKSLERSFTGNKAIRDPVAVADKTAKLNAEVLDRMAQEINKNANEGTQPITAWDLFRQKARLEQIGQKGVRAGDIQPEAYAEPASLANLSQAHENLTSDEQVRAYYTDQNTGLLNERGAELREPDPARPMTARFSLEGTKAANDKLGHLSVDGALRSMANTLSQFMRDGVKRGGDIEGDVVDQAQADQIAAAMSQALDPSGRVKVVATAGERLPTTDKTLEAVGKTHNTKKAELVKAGTFADRGAIPVGYEKSAAEFNAVADAWRNAESRPNADLTDTHRAAFNALGPEQTGFETYREHSGLLNDLGFRRAQEISKPKYTVSADARGIAKMNEAMGRKRTDIVIDILSESFARAGGGEIDLGHLHGDEYAAQGNDKERIDDFFAKVRETTGTLLLIGKNEKGGYFLQEGLHFVYGIGTDFDHADRTVLPAEKAKQGSVSEPQLFESESERDAAVEKLLAGRRDLRPVDLDRLHRQRNQERSGAAPSRARGEAGSTAGQEPDQVRRPGAAGAGGEDLRGGVSPAPIGGPGAEAPGQAGTNDVALQGSAEARPGEVTLAADTPGARAPRGVVFHQTDSTTLPRAWSHWDGYQHVMESIGGSDASPSEQADGQYRRWLKNKKLRKPGPFASSGFEQVNNELDRTGRGEGVSGALEAWVELNRHFKTGLRWENMRPVIDAMRTVPGLERLRLPEEVETRIYEARHNADIEREHGVLASKITLEQPGGDKPRGSISFELPRPDGKPRRYEMNLDGADESTAAHESFHMLTEIMHDVAADPRAPQSLKDDYQALINWMGHASPEERVANTKERISLERQKAKGALTDAEQARLTTLTAKEERATAGWEEYLLAGKAPNARLADVFSRFGSWLARIYKGASPAQQFQESYGEALGLTPEVNAIFDRLLATESQIESTRNALEMQPLPVAHRNMTPEEQQQYAEATERMQSEARTSLLKAIQASDAKAKSNLINEERQRLTEERNSELDKMPVYRVLSFLQDGEFIRIDDATGESLHVDPPSWLIDPETGKQYRLDRKNVESLLGKGGWKTLPALTTSAKGGINVGELSDFFGFPSSEDFLRTLQESVQNPRDAVVKRDVQTQLEQIYGPALIDNPSRLYEEAMSAEHNDAAAKRIMLEIRSLRRQLNQDFDPRTEALSEKTRKATAKTLIAQTAIKDLAPGYYRRAEQSSAKRALEAALGGKIDKAMGEREAQLLNQYLYKNARESKERADHIREQLQKKTTDTYRAALGKAVYEEKQQDGTVIRHREYLDAHDALMSSLGIGQRKPEDFKLDDLLARMDLDAASIEFDVGVVRDVLDSGKPYDELTTPQAIEVDAAIKNIRESANSVNEILVDGKRTTVKSWVDRIRGDLELRPNLGKEANDKTQVGKPTKTRLTIQGIDGGLLDSSIFDMMGPTAKEFFIDRYASARDKKDALGNRVLPKVIEAFEAMPKALRDRRHEVVPGLDRDLPVPETLNEEGPRSRQWLWMAFLNMGNRGPKSNAERLTRPFGWTEQQVVDAIGKHLTPAECEFLQKILDLTDKELWPEVSAKEERKTGLPPEKIKASPIEVTFADGTQGTYAGGYFPAKYKRDVAVGDIGARQDASIQSFYGPGYERASTAKGHTKARAAGYANVLDLSWDVLTNHLAQVVHDVAFDEYVRDSARVMTHPELHDAVFQRLGSERQDQLNDWLKGVAREHIDSLPESMRWFRNAANPLANAYVAATIGASIPVMAANLVDAGFAVTQGDVSIKNGLAAIALGIGHAPKMLFGASEMRQKALEMSPELRHRQGEHARKVRDFELKAIGQNQSEFTRAKGRVALMMGTFMEAADALSSTQVWHAAYNDAIEAGKVGDEAVRFADGKVRDVLVNHDKPLQSAILRNKAAIGAWDLFYSWFNKRYNGIRRAADRAYVARGNLDAFGGTVATAKACGQMLATLVLMGTGAELMGGRGKQSDESWWQWALRKSMGSAISLLPWGGNLTPIADYIVTGQRKAPSERAPAFLALGYKAYEEIGKAFSEDSDAGDKAALALKGAVGIALAGAQLPLRQIDRTGGYILKLVDGQAQDTSPQGIASGLLYGERENQPGNPVRPGGL